MTTRIWLHITSGRGPAECQLAVAKFADVLKCESVTAGVTCEALEIVEGEVPKSALSVLLSLEGPAERVRDFAQGSAGSVLWICPSPVRPNHKRKNWFVGVEALSPPELYDSELKQSDIVYEAMRASGPGGQHVNKTESAVRATHRPTGLVATAREERSQAMNKKLAAARLAGMLRAGTDKAMRDANRDLWTQHDTLERGRPTRTFRGKDFREVVG